MSDCRFVWLTIDVSAWRRIIVQCKEGCCCCHTLHLSMRSTEIKLKVALPRSPQRRSSGTVKWSVHLLVCQPVRPFIHNAFVNRPHWRSRMFKNGSLFNVDFFPKCCYMIIKESVGITHNLWNCSLQTEWVGLRAPESGGPGKASEGPAEASDKSGEASGLGMVSEGPGKGFL